MKSLLTLALITMTINAFTQVNSYSDEFDKTCSLVEWNDIEDTEGWDNTHMESIDVNMTNSGQLTLIPWTTAWFQSRRSNLMYHDITGDFVLTTNVTVTNKLENDQPGSIFSLAGLMIRGPKDMSTGSPVGAENYVFISIGSANVTSVPKFEVKTTVNNSSTLYYFPITGSTAQIRMARIGTVVIVLYRLPGGSWIVQDRFDRDINEIPATAQVGLVAYTDWPKVNTYDIPFHNANTLNSDLDPDPTAGTPFNADLIGRFDYARFDEVVVPPAYQGADFSDESAVSDAVILDILGFDSQYTGLSGWKIWNGSTSDWNTASNWQDGILPTAQDSILIPNCGCPEVVFPSLGNSTVSCASLVIEEGGGIDIENSGSINVLLTGQTARFENYGIIENFGTLNVNSIGDKSIINRGTIECKGTGQCNFNE